jgi:hypothetical protein
MAVPVLFLWRVGGRIDPPALAALVLVFTLTLLASASSLRKLFAVASTAFQVEFDHALVVMYLSALPMLAVLALNGNPWVFISGCVVILATVRTYLRILKVLP